MKFALDSNFISSILNSRGKGIDKVINAVLSGDSLYIPPQVYFEIKRWLLTTQVNAKTVIFN